MTTPCPNLAIIVVIRDGWEEFAKECVESILEALKEQRHPKTQLIIVNNGSTEETRKAMFDFSLTVGSFSQPKVTSIDLSSLAEAWNHGIEMAQWMGCDTFAIVNSDTIFHAYSFQNAFDQFHQIGHFEKCDHPAPYLLSMTDYGKQDDRGNDDYSVHFNAFLIGNRTIEALRSSGDPQEGLFDPGFKVACFEDNDYHMRIKVYLGAHFCRVATGAYFNHYGSGTQKIHPVPKEATEANMAYYKSKWGGPPGEEMFVPNLMREYRALLTMKMIEEIP